MRSIRCLSAILLSLLLPALVLAGTTTSAQAKDDPYAYWLYFSVEGGKFSYQDVGPGTYVPEDGDVEGYRYASALFPPTQEPRADLTEVNFDTVCADTAAEDGKKRVAVLIDYGIDGDAPSGDADAPDPVAECAVVPTAATGLQTLQSVADVRTDKNSGVCGIDAYPSGGDCFAAADAVSAEDSGPVDFTILGADEASDDDGDDSNLPLLLGVGAAVVVLGGGGLLLARRNRSA